MMATAQRRGYRICSEDLADERPHVPILDRVRLATLATLLMDLTHVDSNEAEARAWCIDEAIRQLANLRARVNTVGF